MTTRMRVRERLKKKKKKKKKKFGTEYFLGRKGKKSFYRVWEGWG